MNVAAIQKALAERKLDGWLLYDFRGLNVRSFDGRGNYSLGIREQIIFPEINYDDIGAVRGLDVAITTTAKSDEQALALLRGLGMPFAIEDDRRES